jgi:ferredoxin-like protein FixX
MEIPFYLRKPAVYLHQDCTHFDEAESKCKLKTMGVKKKELACKDKDIANPEKRDSFVCKHCHSPKWKPYEVNRIWYKVGDDDVQIAFFECIECGEITAACAKDYQRVWAIPSEEDYAAQNWSGVNILLNV